MLAVDGKLSAVALAEKVGITAKAVEKHLARLKADASSNVSDLPKVYSGGLFDFILSACNLLHLQKIYYPLNSLPSNNTFHPKQL